MENATKALTMAASVLIALVIIGAILLVFNNINSYQKVNERLKEDAKILEFNNQFETYNRTDVRGSDIFSLVNRVMDYNERQSSIGSEGSDLGYKPIKLTINLTPNGSTDYIDNIKVPNEDSTGRQLIKDNLYTIYTTTGKMDTEKGFGKVTQDILNIENGINGRNPTKITQTELTELAKAITTIFIPDNVANDINNNYQKDRALKKFNDITGRNITSSNFKNEIGENSNIRKDVYDYYEYIQFKRCHFDCVSEDGKSSGVKYDDNGRIIEMYYVINGNIE